MNRHIIYTLLVFIGCLGSLMACSDDMGPDTPNLTGISFEDGIEITLKFAEMTTVPTKSFPNITPNLTDLDLYLFVFDDGSLLQTIHIAPSETEEADNLADDTHARTNGHIRFKAYLPQTDGNAVIHIVAIDDPEGVFASQIDAIGYGTEDSVMPALKLSNEQDAYWQRIDLETPITVTVKNEDDPTLKNIDGTEDEVIAKFARPIPLIRNFSKITLKSNVPDNIFEIIGWTVVNDLDAGSVAPWYSMPGMSDIIYPRFVVYDDQGNPTDQVLDYDDLVFQGYHGVSQNGASRQHKLDDLGEGEDWYKKGEDIFLYERKITSVNPLYILLYGEYKGGSGASKKGYYKLALAKRDKDTGLVTEYDVLRNITYNIIITGVTAPGYDTPADAASGPAFNNISGDVTTKNMTQISDGVDMLYVNFVNYVITQPNHVIDFKYRFVNDITGSKTLNNDAVRFKTQGIGIAPGNVIKAFGTNVVDGDAENSYTDQEAVVITERDGSEWRNVMIKANDPSDELQIQTFTIYTEPANAGTASDGQTGIGLSRTVNLVLRNPWNFIRMEVFPEHWADASQWPDYDPDDAPTNPDVNYYVGSGIGAPLTIFWELPAGLPEAMFPLQFQIESDRQNIENAGVGNAVVQSGPSLFSGVADSRISYIKTVNWQDYAPDGENSTESSRIIRARFTTTTSISSLFDDQYISTVRLHNPYFNDIDDKFLRKIDVNGDREETVDPKPMVWDFSDSAFSSFISDISGGTQNVNITINGLTIMQNGGSNVTNANRRMTSGISDGNTYVAARRGNDSFSFTVNYPEGKAVMPVLKVVTEENVPASTTRVNLNVAHTPSNLSVQPEDDYTQDITDKVERKYTYAVMREGTTLKITLSPAGNYDANNAVRIYRIEFYPMGEEAAND